MSSPAPGWYPDPGSTDQIRYWDGAAWTDHTAPRVAAPPTPDSALSAPAVPAQGPVPLPQPPGAPSPLATPPNQSHTAKVVVAVAVVILVVVGGGAGAIFLTRDDQPASTPSRRAPTTSLYRGPDTSESPSPDVETNCVIEKALVGAAVAAAKAANQIAGENQTPADFLPDQTGQYYTWEGDSPDTWQRTPIGTPPC